MKEVVGFIAVVLAFAAYVPYIRDIFSGKTKPHVYSWFVWGLLNLIIFALQTKGGAGAGAYATLSAGTISFFVFFLGLRNGTKDITKSDTLFFMSALAASGLWIFAKQPTFSIILLVVIDIFGFIPTIRKSWKRPQEETTFTWGLNGFRHGLSIFALQHYNVLTLLYPVVWSLANILFSLMLITRCRSAHLDKSK